MIFTICSFCAKGQTLDSIKYDYGYLYYHEYGQGKPVLLLSGGPGNDCMQLEKMAVALGKKYHVILPEQRGTGRSVPSLFDSTSINLKSAVTDVNRLLDHLKLKQITIVGHSWGGMLAMCFASVYPSSVTSLILVAPGPYNKWDEKFRRIQENLRSRLGKKEVSALDSLNRKIAAGEATLPDSIEQRKIIRSAYIFDKARLDSLFSIIDSKVGFKMQQLMWKDLRKNYDLTRVLNKYRGPVDVICGSQDILAFNSYDLKILRPSVQLYWIEQSGHFPMYEQSEKFYGVLFNLLDEVR